MNNLLSLYAEKIKSVILLEYVTIILLPKPKSRVHYIRQLLMRLIELNCVYLEHLF